jgi:Uma2 family endonuclease
MVRTGYLTLPLNPWPPEKGEDGSTPEPGELDEGVPLPPWETLPTMYDLPSEDPEEPGLPDEFHDFQPQMLRETCQPPRYPLENMFIGTDLNLYYNVHQQLWQKRPDWFLVLGAPRSHQQQEMRLSYVIWQEGISPFLVVELLSPSTRAEDLGQTQQEAGKPPTKWYVYEQVLRIPYYVVFDRYDNQLRVFRLVGSRYEPMELAEPRFWLDELELGLGVWAGVYQGTEGLWLRWYDRAGAWLATPAERAEQESQRAEQESQRAEQEMAQRERAEQELEAERQRSQRMADQLRSLGIDPNQI